MKCDAKRQWHEKKCKNDHGDALDKTTRWGDADTSKKYMTSAQLSLCVRQMLIFAF